MNEKDFIELCKNEVCNYTNKQLDKTDILEKVRIGENYHEQTIFSLQKDCTSYARKDLRV